MGIVYGNIRDANGEDFEIDLEAGTTYYIWTNIGDDVAHHVQDTTMTLFDADGTTALAQNDDGPVGAVNSYIVFTPTASIQQATILVAPKTRQDRGTFQLQVSLTEPDLTVRPPPPTPPSPPPSGLVCHPETCHNDGHWIEIDFGEFDTLEECQNLCACHPEATSMQYNDDGWCGCMTLEDTTFQDAIDGREHLGPWTECTI